MHAFFPFLGSTLYLILECTQSWKRKESGARTVYCRGFESDIETPYVGPSETGTQIITPCRLKVLA